MLKENSVAVVQDSIAIDCTDVDIKSVMKDIQSHSKPFWWGGGIDSHKRENLHRFIVEDFVEGRFKDGIVARDDRYNAKHIYSVKNNGTELWLFKNNVSVKVRVCIARKLDGIFIGNSSSLEYGRPQPSRKRPKPRARPVGSARPFGIQETCSEVMTMVPFGLFKDAQLDINTFELIEKGPEETLNILSGSIPRSVHFTGAICFKVQFKGRSKSLRGDAQYFLFDADRNDIKLRNVNYFFSRLSRPVTSIKDAYDSLKPQEVREAELFMKKECPRQGEWFFIPVLGFFEPMMTNGSYQRAVLQSKGNRPHYVSELSREEYVRGKVTHGGYEHHPITLIDWCKPVPNTAIESFRISGGVD